MTGDEAIGLPNAVANRNGWGNHRLPAHLRYQRHMITPAIDK
jgi:hypothetical protein